MAAPPFSAARYEAGYRSDSPRLTAAPALINETAVSSSPDARPSAARRCRLRRPRFGLARSLSSVRRLAALPALTAASSAPLSAALTAEDDAAHEHGQIALRSSSFTHGLPPEAALDPCCRRATRRPRLPCRAS
jgi:hypothetical protein